MATLAACSMAHPAAADPPPWQPVPPAPAARATTGIALPVGKCVNLGNTLEPPREAGWGGRPFRDSDATNIRQAGFATVRVPVRFSGYAGASPPYRIDPEFMARVRHVVDTSLAAGLNVILNVHHYEELFTAPEQHRDRLAGLWRQVAAEFREAPAGLWFELINEPHDRLNDSNLAGVLAPALAAVRETNPTRPVIVGGQNWSGINSLATLAAARRSLRRADLPLLRTVRLHPPGRRLGEPDLPDRPAARDRGRSGAAPGLARQDPRLHGAHRAGAVHGRIWRLRPDPDRPARALLRHGQLRLRLDRHRELRLGLCEHLPALSRQIGLDRAESRTRLSLRCRPSEYDTPLSSLRA